jgi:endo-1,4-beta-xylanase
MLKADVPMRSLDRRRFLRGALAGAAVCALGRSAFADDPGLHELARAKNLFFGCSIEGFRMADDPAYARIVARECGAATPEGALQWKALQPRPGPITFTRMDGALAYSQDHRMWLRGHSVLWHQAVPDWAVEEFTSAREWDRLVVPYIQAVAQRYGAFLRHWDVLNEALEPRDGRPDGLRSWWLARLMGEAYVVQAFRHVHQAAPHVRLYYNDFGLEYADRRSLDRRACLLRAFERWLKAGVPLHGLGLQAHLETRMGGIDQESLRGFLAEVAGLGLDIVVSELDVREHVFALPLPQRDRIVADETRRFLDAVLVEPRVHGVVTWGMADRHSWLLWHHDRRNRGLPYDGGLRSKAMRQAIAEALRNAPARAA